MKTLFHKTFLLQNYIDYEMLGNFMAQNSVASKALKYLTESVIVIFFNNYVKYFASSHFLDNVHPILSKYYIDMTISFYLRYYISSSLQTNKFPIPS